MSELFNLVKEKDLKIKQDDEIICKYLSKIEPIYIEYLLSIVRYKIVTHVDRFLSNNKKDDLPRIHIQITNDYGIKSAENIIKLLNKSLNKEGFNLDLFCSGKDWMTFTIYVHKKEIKETIEETIKEEDIEEHMDDMNDNN